MQAPLTSNTVFHVSDLARSIDFYTTLLGFKVDFSVGEPANYAGLNWNGVLLHLGCQLPHTNSIGHGNVYLVFDEVDTIYKRLLDAGVEFYSPIGDQPYGMRDFCAKDPDGNQIGMGCSIVG